MAGQCCVFIEISQISGHHLDTADMCHSCQVMMGIFWLELLSLRKDFCTTPYNEPSPRQSRTVMKQQIKRPIHAIGHTWDENVSHGEDLEYTIMSLPSPRSRSSAV